MKKKALNSFALFLILFSSLATAAGRPGVDYALIRRSPRKNVFFMGSVMLSRSVKLSFLSNVQLTYVASENEVVRGKITDADGNTIYQGDAVAKARSTKEQIIVNIAGQKVKKTKQTLKDASLNLSRTKKLYERHVSSERQHEQAENDYLQAASDYDVGRLELLEAQTNLENMTLNAPFSGVIEKVFASAGSSLCDDQPVLVLSVFDPMSVKVELHDVVTDLLCVNDQYLVYPTGFPRPEPGWLKTEEIFTSYMELSVKNRLIPKRKLSPDEQKLPRIYSRMRVIETRDKLWVPASALKKDKEGTFLWVISQSADCRKLKTGKVRVKTENMFIQKRSAQYQAVETANGLKASDIVAVRTGDNLLDGGLAVMYDSCWLFQPDEKVWVSIPHLTEHMYTVPNDSIKTFRERSFLLVIDNSGHVAPIEVFVYDRSGQNAEIIAKNLKTEMKIICTKESGLLYLGQKVALGKKVVF
ncbi:MAG: hypothetical protein PHV82_02660 [Victivallaceae bacterium]|nr:hypothetical protein [Victivallaceae bacterium]